jgi:hypothetical protein
MKFIFLKSGDYLELEPNNTPIASAWFDNIFSKKMNMSYVAKGTAHVVRTNQILYKLKDSVNIVNQFAAEKNLPQLWFSAIEGLDQPWMNAAHKKWVKYTHELSNVVNGDDTKEQYPAFSEAWQNINMYIHALEYYYSVYFTNTKGAYLERGDVKIQPEDCEYSQHDLILKFDDLGKHQYDQWITGSEVDDETSNYKILSARFEYTFNPHQSKGTLSNPEYVKWCKQNNLQVLPPWIILGNFKKNRWDSKELMHKNLSQGLEVGFEL